MFIVDNFLGVLGKFNDFKGRASRAEYWYFILANFIIGFVVGFVGGFTGNTVEAGYASNIYNLVILLPSIAVAIRRAHDVGKSGWFMLIPFYNLYLACTAGEPTANQYGPNPYGDIAATPVASVTTSTPTPGQ